MPIIWQNSQQNPQQEFAVGNQEDDTFAYVWSRQGKAFRDTVSIRSSSMGGWNTTQSYDILMQLAKERVIMQTSGELLKKPIKAPQDWYGVRHQYSHGTNNNHLLVPRTFSSDGIVLGISNANNSHIQAVEIFRAHVGDRVFDILLRLREAIQIDNETHGHWYDVLQSRE